MTHRKWLHAGLIAFASALGEVALHLQSGNAELGKAAVFGMVIGVFSRVLGAALAAAALEGGDEPPTS